jgi:colanic acid/amylovoran biosynthesis glycosyltransferase
VNRPLRIAMFIGSFPVPSETFIVRQVTGLLDLGHEVDLYADTRGDLTAPRPAAIDQYHLLERTTFMDLPPECAPWELPAWPATGQTWIPGASSPIENQDRLSRAAVVQERCHARNPKLAEQVLSESNYGYRALSLSALHRLDRLSGLARQYDVVHAQFGPVGESFRFASELWHAPYLVSFHGYDFCAVPRREGLHCYERLFQAADLVTVNSRYTWNRVCHLGCPEAKLRKLPMGVDVLDWNFCERRPAEVIRLITVARLVEIKGHEYCLRALAQARTRHPELHYDIVGDGAERGKLEALTRELGLQDVVRFHGTQAGPSLKSLLDAAHLFLLCSVDVSGDQEGQGLALLEAQACGLPVIANRHGALPESMVEGGSGWLVAERDVAALARQITVGIEHADAWPAMGRRGRAWVEQHFDIRTLNKQLAEFYQERIMARQRSHL